MRGCWFVLNRQNLAWFYKLKPLKTRYNRLYKEGNYSVACGDSAGNFVAAIGGMKGLLVPK
jgi:hypothetical protein